MSGEGVGGWAGVTLVFSHWSDARPHTSQLVPVLRCSNLCTFTPDLDRVLRLEESVPTVTTRTQTTSTVASLVSRSRLSDWPKSGGRKRTSGRKVFYRGKHSSRSDTHSLVCALSQLVCERRSMENIFLATEPDHDATHLPACASRCAAKRCLKKN